MADLAVSLAKTVVEGALTRALSAIEEEAALRQSTQNDLEFITGEFQMMQSFLNVADEERVRNSVVRTWVRQVRDLAYNVEDCIEYVIHLDQAPDWCCRCLPLPDFLKPGLPLDKAVAEIKLLKGRVEEVSLRNLRYNLISDSGSKPVAQQQLLPAASDGTTTFEMLIKARDATKMQRRLGDLTKLLITKKSSDDLGVISVWAAGGNAYTTPIISEAYGEPEICESFRCRGWAKLTHPFNPHEFQQSLLIQFHTKPCIQNETSEYVNILERLEKATEGELVKDFMEIMKKERYLVVLENISSMVEWETVRAYLPDGKNGSWVIISTQESEVARLCVGDPWQVFELKHYSPEQSVCVFFLEGSQGGSNAEASSSMDAHNNANVPIDQFHLFGARMSQVKDLRGYIARARVSGFAVVSVWGIAGVGKSALVRNLYHSIKHDDQSNRMFNMCSWVDVSHPFNLRIFAWNLLLEFQLDSRQQIGISNPVHECRKLLEENGCLVVIDGLQSREEWDLIRHSLVSTRSRSIIVMITTEASIATHCANREEAMFNVKSLEDDEACDLFTKVCKLERLRDPEDLELRELISKCGGLPKVIVTVAGFLGPITVNRMSSAVNLSSRFIHDLETKQEFDNLRGLFGWMHSYFRTCPDHLKPCILYLSIFSQGQSIRRRRVVRRWIAEGYSRDTSNVSAEENGEKYFSTLLDLSIIKKTPHSISSAGGRMVLCQVNSFFREYIISRQKDEDLVFELEGTCTLTTQRTGRHLVLKESWDRDKIVFDSIDLSRLRSLTVFGKWEPFFVTEAMKVLRVLDLENAEGLTDEYLEQMLKLLPRLKFLSLRGATEISHLPSSLARLRQLETLDVRGTSIVTLPPSITNLNKLQYIRAGTAKEPSVPCAHRSWLSSCRRACPAGGVVVSAGIEKLTALHTVGIVNVGLSGGKDILRELKKLTQLHKLEVTCISKKYIEDFCSAISGHIHLESLSIWLSKDNGRCLDDIPWSQQEPQKKTMQKLQSLKIYGLEKKVPAWIKNLPKLTKLELGISMSEQAEVTKFLAEIKQLCILRLWVKKLLQDGHDNTLNFHVKMNGQEQQSYLNLKILEISCNSQLNISFGSEAMQNLELLTARWCSGSTLKFMEIKNLSKQKLKEVRLIGSHDAALKDDIAKQLDEHPRNPPLKLEELAGC